jgi:hypothetical protein
LVDLASIPDRLQSDVSVSCGSSADHTPPTTPKLSNGNNVGRAPSFPLINAGIPDHVMSLSEKERQRIHILVVEDK